MVAAESRRHVHGSPLESEGGSPPKADPGQPDQQIQTQPQQQPRQLPLPQNHSTVSEPWFATLQRAIKAGNEEHLAREFAKYGSSCPTQQSMQNGAKPSERPRELNELLRLAAQQGQAGCVNLLVKHGAECNDRSESHGLTPLHEAARHGHEQCLKVRGNPVHLASLPFFTDPLRVFRRLSLPTTAWCNYCLQVLLGAGADPNARDKTNGNVLYAAIVSGTADSLSRFPLQVPGCLFPLPLFSKCLVRQAAKSAPCVDAILNSYTYIRDAEVVSLQMLSETVNNGLQPIHAAVWHQASSVLHLLLGRGADPNAKCDACRLVTAVGMKPLVRDEGYATQCLMQFVVRVEGP